MIVCIKDFIHKFLGGGLEFLHKGRILIFSIIDFVEMSLSTAIGIRLHGGSVAIHSFYNKLVNTLFV